MTNQLIDTFLIEDFDGIEELDLVENFLRPRLMNFFQKKLIATDKIKYREIKCLGDVFELELLRELLEPTVGSEEDGIDQNFLDEEKQEMKQRISNIKARYTPQQIVQARAHPKYHYLVDITIILDELFTSENQEDISTALQKFLDYVSKTCDLKQPEIEFELRSQIVHSVKEAKKLDSQLRDWTKENDELHVVPSVGQEGQTLQCGSQDRGEREGAMIYQFKPKKRIE